MDDDTLKGRVIHLVEQIGEQPLGEVGTGEDLLVSGFLDSFGFVQLLLLMNTEFGVTISEEMQLDPRLRTIDGLLEIVRDG